MSFKKPQIPQVYDAITDVGNARTHNEDNFAASSPFFAVADGMGGHQAGEVASKIAITTMLNNIPKSIDATALINAVKMANAAVIRGAQDGTGKPGMGTTITAALIYNDQLIIAQVGDSRAYLLHDGHLQRITRDHSLVADLVEQGRITEQQARRHPQRSVITRALGNDPSMEPDIYSLRVSKDDRLLLCSDGLSSMIEDKAIESILQSYDNPSVCCKNLVREALAAGGLDNITCIVVDPLRSTQTGAESSKVLALLKHKERRAPFFWACAFVLILVLCAVGFYAYTQNTYYLQTQNDFICIYRGLPGSVAGIEASSLIEKTDIHASDLAPTTAEKYEDGVTVSSLDEAYERIFELRSYLDNINEDESTNTTSGATNAANE